MAWEARLNRIQIGNTCGAHAVMAVIFGYKKEISDPNDIYNSIDSKMGNGYIYPWGLTRYLGEKGIRVSTYYCGLLNRNQKEQILKESITYGKPVILIVGNKRYLHYITILGFGNDSYHIYDSMFKGDLNLTFPGNRTITSTDLMDLWESARFKRISINMAIM